MPDLAEGSRLVLVEGLPFSGKSTLSEFLAEQLTLNGIEAEWVSEGTMLSRYFPGVMHGLEEERPPQPAELRWEWDAFAEAIAASDRTIVLDSAFSYAAVHPLVWLNLQDEAIHRHLRAIRASCQPLNPKVIHLLVDPTITLPASIVERGEVWREHIIGQSDANPHQQAKGLSGLDGAIQLEIECQELTREALESWDTLTLQVTGDDWPALSRKALDFLGLTHVQPTVVSLAPEVLSALVGEFESEAQRRLLVVLEDGHLELRQKDGRIGPMIPISEHRFHVQASDVDVEFDSEGASLNVLRRSGPSTLYRRLPSVTPPGS
jgi:hypothetical protein